MQFILRHISEGTTGYEGVYRKDRWEYPIKALREVVRNAIVHRDYSLSGKDIKIAVFDDKIEITSPGKLMPPVDFNLMEAGQSEIRNKIIAGVFKKLGIIEQWGNRLKIISEDLKNYPEIEFKWSKPGIAFRVTFLKKNYEEDITPKTTLKTTRNITDLLEKHVVTTRGELLNLLQNKLGENWEKVGGKLGDNQIKIVLLLIEDSSITIEKLSNLIGISTTSIENNIGKLKKLKLIKRIGSARSGHWEVLRNE
ncbi:MAG: ATP-binding protein [Candidatus Eremiobacterota bacterium]